MSYRQLFDEAIGVAPPSRVDLDQVIHRQRRAARLRPVLAGIALLALAAGTAMFVVRNDQGRVTVPADELAGFPAYLEGTRVVAAESADIADRTLTLTYTPSAPDVVLFSRCGSPAFGHRYLGLSAQVSAGAVTETMEFCTSSVVHPVPIDWAATGVDAGERVTITVTLAQLLPPPGGGEPPLPTEGTFGLAVGEPVPFEEYVLPSRPAVLEPLDDPLPGAVVLRADPGHPNAPVEETFRWDAARDICAEDLQPLELTSQTPGSLRVLLDGVEIAHRIWWDYQDPAYGTSVYVFSLMPVCEEFADGEEITIRAEPEHMTGDWYVAVTR